MQLRGSVKADRPLLVVALPEETVHLDTDLPILLTGVGKVNTAVAVTRVLASARPSVVINLGTAGALLPGLAGTTHEVGTIVQHDFDSPSIAALVGRAFGVPIQLAEDGLTLATGDVFVSDPLLRAALAERAHLVDMEGWAVAAAGAAFGVPVRVIKHVSDEADASASVSWTSTVAECSHALAAWLSVALSVA